MTKEIDLDLVEKAEVVRMMCVDTPYRIKETVAQAMQEVRDARPDLKYICSIQEQMMRAKLERDEGNKKAEDEFQRAEANIANKKWFQEQIHKERSLCDRLVEALVDISEFHDDGHDMEDLDKKVGFTGWTCCGALKTYAQKVLEAHRKAREGK